MTVENFFFNENNGNGRKYLKFQRNNKSILNVIVTNLHARSKKAFNVKNESNHSCFSQNQTKFKWI